MGEAQLLAELERVDRRVVAVAVAVPLTEQEGDRHQVRVQVRRDLERHAADRSDLAAREAVDGQARDDRDTQGDEHQQADEEDLHEQRV